MKENPLITKIEIEGNKELKTEDIRKVFLLGEFKVFSDYSLDQDVKQVQALYNKAGLLNAEIKHNIVKIDESRVKIIYTIKEGKKSYISSIKFFGNTAFKDNRLKRVLASKEKAFYRIFSSVDVYDEERVQYDQVLIQKFYMSHGYPDIDVKITREKDTNNNIVLNFNVFEGTRYKIGKVDVKTETHASTNATNIDLGQLRKLIKIEGGSYFNGADIEAEIEKITESLANSGHAFTVVDYDIRKNGDSGLIDVIFLLKQTQKMYVNAITIKNNTRTLDRVIRREMRLAEGDPYNVSKLERSKERIRALGFFNDVNVEASRSIEKHDKVDIEIAVDEASTASIKFGGAYNTLDGIMGMVAYSETNFLGKGQKLDFSVSRAVRAFDASVSFIEPYFLHKPFSLGFELYTTSKDREKESSYKIRSSGFGINGGYEINERIKHVGRYSLRKEDIYDVSPAAPYLIQAQAGKSTLSMFGHRLSYEHVDDVLDPKSGISTGLNQDIAGLFGQVHYINHNFDIRYFIPVIKDSIVLTLSGKAGVIAPWRKDHIRLSDRLFIGSESVRGFDVAGIGPRHKVSGDAIGGDKYYNGSLELTFPVGTPKETNIKGAIFLDCGSSWGLNIKDLNMSDINYSKKLRSSFGVGLIWQSKIAVIRLDYGVPISKAPFDKVKNFRFLIGNSVF